MTIREASQVSKHTPARRVVLRAVAAGATALAVPGAFSQTWPAKPIRLIVPFVAGGGADATARTTGDGAVRSTRTAVTRSASMWSPNVGGGVWSQAGSGDMLSRRR